MSQYLSLAFENEVLSAAEIVAIEGGELHESLASRLIVDIIDAGPSKVKIGSLSVTLNSDQSAAKALTLKLKTSFMIK